MIPDCRIIQGDALTELRKMDAESVSLCVTSPPYWGLRDYGTATWEGGDPDCEHQQGRNGSGRADGIVDERGQRNRDGSGAYLKPCRKCGARRIDQGIGLEQTPDAWAARLVEVFREVRRVLHPSGTVWCNVGDCYNSPNTHSGPANKVDWTVRLGQPRGVTKTLKPKDLIGLPWLLAFALRADGWYLRSDIIWAKPNPMPESVTDRPTNAHEHLFLLSKRPTYFFDAEAIREPGITGDMRRPYGSNGAWQMDGRPVEQRHGGELRQCKQDYTGNRTYTGFNARWDEAEEAGKVQAGRNRRNVWTIATEPYPEAHFATFPSDLVKPCVLAGTSERGVCGAMVKKLRLRADLTEEERAKVYARLGPRACAF